MQMHIFTPRLRPTATIATFVLLFSSLILPTLATPSTDLIIPEAPPKDLVARTLVRRAEEAGAGCSTEGQWHCMTNSFQRCAGGHWSVEMAMSEGTRCTPAGYTDDYNFQIEHDGTVNGEGNDTDDRDRQTNSGGDGGQSVGPKGFVSRTTAVAILGLWAAVGFLV
ncbi:hypothetical protein ACHAPT_002161 [Fusarium lateritium]